MKHILMLFAVMFIIIAIGTVAQQTSNESRGSKDDKEVTNDTPSKVDDQAQATSLQSTVTPEITPKVPRQYPIAAGVWYPGDPLPKEPSRYYRIRCWPGCHSYGEWATFPKTKNKTQSSY